MNEIEIARREVRELGRTAPQSAMHRAAVEKLKSLVAEKMAEAKQ